MGFHGNALAVYGAIYLCGTTPGSRSTNECSVSETLAWALCGSQDVIGQPLTFETADKQSYTYVVCCIFSSNEEILLDSLSSENGFPHIELAGISQDTPAQRVRQFFIGAGISRTISDSLCPSIGLVGNSFGIPTGNAYCIDFCALDFVWNFLEKQFRELFLFVTALTVVVLLPLWLSNLPGWLVPNQWGNADSWAELLSTSRDRLYEWVTLIPTARDSPIKNLLLQESIRLN